jgi:hypothetical protein
MTAASRGCGRSPQAMSSQMPRRRARPNRMQHAKAPGNAIALFLLACSAVAACTSDDDAADIGLTVDGGVAPDAGECMITAPTECPDPSPRYADVEPIFQDRCVICHVGSRGGPWALTSYGHVLEWRDLIRGVMLSCAMPPPDAGIEMADEERELILAWIRCGAPE